ncbi:hypothetical protein M5689_023345 [Euphorbia peplus]|nr:hypothetical protein M5689_023345 [Euphorbia peplus]
MIYSIVGYSDNCCKLPACIKVIGWSIMPKPGRVKLTSDEWLNGAATAGGLIRNLLKGWIAVFPHCMGSGHTPLKWISGRSFRSIP